MNYDLEERTTIFAERVLEFCKNLPKNTITIPLINQLIRCGTSIGANYTEANGASSRRDFKNKIYLCKKEAMETKYWLRLLSKTENKYVQECKALWKEAHELTLIFSKISKSSK